MHAHLLIALLAAATPAVAWPGMTPGGVGGSHVAKARFHYGDMASDIARHAVRRDNASAVGSEPVPRPLLGDLAHLPHDELTQVGLLAKRILLGEQPATHARNEARGAGSGGPSGSDVRSAEHDVSDLLKPGVLKEWLGGGKKTTTSIATSTFTTAAAATSAASCSTWKKLADEVLVPAFTDVAGGGCSALARGAIRLGFHDAAAWNATTSYGGADGSIVLAADADELDRSDNAGLAATVTQVRAWLADYRAQGVSAADLVQFAAIVATVVCPLGPRIRFLAGRPDSARAPPTGLLPSAFADAPSLIAIFEAKTFSAADLVALVGAHSVSQQFFTDAATAGDAQDTTPGVWDTLFYDQTTTADAPSGVYRFPSDIALSSYAATSGTWRAFSGQRGQRPWDAAYATAYFRMSLLGVSNINGLTDCSNAVP